MAHLWDRDRGCQDWCQPATKRRRRRRPMAPPARGAQNGSNAQFMEKGGKAKQKKPGKIAMIRMGYEQLVCTVVRPPRVNYTVEDLGMVCKRINGCFVERKDFDVENARGEILKCSKWCPTKATHRHILYLHSNSSCRLAVVRSPLLQTAVSLESTLVAFDFAGCGISDGDVVTLGINEKDDIGRVVAQIKRDDPDAEIVIWGRSMGALDSTPWMGWMPGRVGAGSRARAQASRARVS